jgi:hypothetical protein
MSDFKPSFPAAKMYRKTSAKGTTYFTGRMGGVKLALVKSRDVTDSGEEIWTLMFSEAPAYQKPAENDGQAKQDTQRPLAPRQVDTSAPVRDDEIPF